MADVLEAEWLREETEPVVGSEWERLRGRLIADQPPWSYPDRAAALLQGTRRVLDLNTGGGDDPYLGFGKYVVWSFDDYGWGAGRKAGGKRPPCAARAGAARALHRGLAGAAGQGDGAVGAGRGAGGVEDLVDDEVVLQRRQRAGSNLAA